MRKNIDWQTESACLDNLTPDHWFSDDPEERRMALEVCKGCPVLSVCREWAITDFPETPDWYVVGGMTKHGIKKARLEAGIQAPPRLRVDAQSKKEAISRVQRNNKKVGRPKKEAS